MAVSALHPPLKGKERDASGAWFGCLVLIVDGVPIHSQFYVHRRRGCLWIVEFWTVPAPGAQFPGNPGLRHCVHGFAEIQPECHFSDDTRILALLMMRVHAINLRCSGFRAMVCRKGRVSLFWSKKSDDRAVLFEWLETTGH